MDARAGGLPAIEDGVKTRPHHHLPVSESLLLLGTDPDNGLDGAQVERRLTTFGRNTLPAAKGPGALRRWLSQFNHPLIYVLLASAAVTAALGETVDSAVIVGVVLVNAVVGYIQESRADAALRALADMTVTTARVVRAGAAGVVNADGLVPGDLIRLEAGDRVPADARLIRVPDLTVDESMLTGESVPVGKHPLRVPFETALADRTNMAYSGTLVIRGQADAVVVATGAATEMGRIQQLVSEAGGVETPLTRKLATFSRWLTVLILVLAVATFAVGLLRGETVSYMVTAAVALAVGAIPEGLPAAVTITLAIGVGRMARRNAIIRHLPAVEALGSTTVVCTDKTGTLTRNRMTAVAVVVGGEVVELTHGDGDAPASAHTGETSTGGGPEPPSGPPPSQGAAGPVGSHEQSPRTSAAGPVADDPAIAALACGALCNNADMAVVDGAVRTAGDPTEAALLVAAHRAGLGLADLESAWPRLDEIPFETERRFMATTHRAGGDESAGGLIIVKGAVEQVLPMCDAQLDLRGQEQRLDSSAVLDQVAQLAGRALRMLATARGRVEAGADPEEAVARGGLVLVGLVCLIDPARPEAITSVARCRDAGIAVKMITGDHPRTGAAIGQEVGLAGPGAAPAVCTGLELQRVPDEGLPELIEATDVFARVSPEQKLRIVEALQSRGEVAAMTGDGVNDAPALKQADIGVAMGEGGSEVAKDSADMILTDDNFATIEAAVEEGRGVFDNLTKFIAWTLPTNLGEGFVILAAIAVGATLPITPLQILWINMTTAVALGLMLAFEPGEPDLMKRPPRDPGEPILTRVLIGRILLVSVILLVGAFGIFDWYQRAGEGAELSRTVAVNAFVAVQIAYLFNCRTLTRPAGSVGWFSNTKLLAGVAITIALQLLFTYAPFMNALFGTTPMALAEWAPLLLLAVIAFLIVEAEKALRHRGSRAVPAMR